MHEVHRDASSHSPKFINGWRGQISVTVGGLLLAGALALLAWWLPARAPVGYYLPNMRGVSSPAPSGIGVIWVRRWPWDTTPPPFRLSMTMKIGNTITDPVENPGPVPLFSSRAAFLLPSFHPDSAFTRTGAITRITVR